MGVVSGQSGFWGCSFLSLHLPCVFYKQEVGLEREIICILPNDKINICLIGQTRSGSTI